MAQSPDEVNSYAGNVELIGRLADLQDSFGPELADVKTESPAAALDSLDSAIDKAPTAYRPYLEEALDCYRHGLYRAAILMTWSAVIQHLYDAVGAHRGGLQSFECKNVERFGDSKKYRRIAKKDDLLYLGDRDFIQIAEDAGMLNRNARLFLHEKLKLRNLCGHPTKYHPGREETVIFIESLALNVLADAQLNWRA